MDCSHFDALAIEISGDVSVGNSLGLFVFHFGLFLLLRLDEIALQFENTMFFLTHLLDLLVFVLLFYKGLALSRLLQGLKHLDCFLYGASGSKSTASFIRRLQARSRYDIHGSKRTMIVPATLGRRLWAILYNSFGVLRGWKAGHFHDFLCALNWK